MMVALALDELTGVVTLEFTCGPGTQAPELFDVLTRQLESGRIAFDVTNAAGMPPDLSRVQ